MDAFEVKIQVRNNWLKARRRKLGLSQRELSRATGVSINVVAAFEALDADHLTSKRTLEHAEKLASFFQVQVEDLFPPERALLQATNVTRTLSGEQVRRMNAVAIRGLLPEAGASPEELAEEHELQTTVREQIQRRLSPRQEWVICRRFGIGAKEMTLQELSEDMNISVEMVRYIEMRALQKLKRRSEIKKFKSGMTE